jgi:hypothetical protein
MTTAPRVLPVVVFAAVAAGVMAWALRDNARFLPTGFVPRHALGSTSHHAGDGAFVQPPPITGVSIVNYPGLIMLAIHLTAVGIVAAAWAIRRAFRGKDSAAARIAFAAAGSVAAAVATIPVAAVSLGNAILFTGTLAAAMTVLQYTFVLVVAGTAWLGVP